MSSVNEDFKVNDEYLAQSSRDNEINLLIDQSTSFQGYRPPFTFARLTIFDKFLLHPELTLILAKHLRPNELFTLYSISRDFYEIINHRLTTVVLSQAQYRVPESTRIFHWRSYRQLCRPDPARRLSPDPQLAARGTIRLIPSFRWLRMLLHREKTCYEITAVMAELGVPVPPEIESVLKKIWLILDIPDNGRRIGLIHNERLFTDKDMYYAEMLIMRLDMVFSDPIDGPASAYMRNMLLSQRSLMPLLRVLKRQECRNALETYRMWLRWRGERPVEMAERLGIDMSTVPDRLLGVPTKLIGTLQYEGWGIYKVERPRPMMQNNNPSGVGAGPSNATAAPPPPPQPYIPVLLMRPDELILSETVRRELDFTSFHKSMILWGYVDPDTQQDYEPRRYPYRLARLGEGQDNEWERVVSNDGKWDNILDFDTGWRPSKKVIRE